MPARPVAPMRAAIALTVLTAACIQVQAAVAFPEVALPEPDRSSYAWAYASVLAGAGLIGGSFALQRRANDTYAEYLTSTDPDRINVLYDRTVVLDHWSSGTLLTGEALLATGLYLRFLRRPPPAHLRVALLPGRCALALRF